MEQLETRKLAKAQAAWMDYPSGSMPSMLDRQYQALGLTPEKLTIPTEYHAIVQMCYDFYGRGGIVAKVIDRMTEFSITEIRNGQRKTSDETNKYFNAILSAKPSRLMRFLRSLALEYYLSGMLLPKIEWVDVLGRELSPDLVQGKIYRVPTFDAYPALLVKAEWAGWGKKVFYLKVPDKDIRLIRSKGSKIKEQQIKYKMYLENYPWFVSSIQGGADSVRIDDSDPILRKEVSFTPYPTPYMYNVLEALVFKQQLRRMDFAVAARVINAILLVQAGDKDFPLTEDNQDLLDNLKQQIMARTGDPRMLERLFMLFTDHTTKLTWVTPDVSALLNQDKYRQVNEEIDESLGFTRVLLTGSTRQGGQISEVSTWAIQPQMEELRSMLLEWMIENIYMVAADLNNFDKIPSPSFKPIRLQDFIKTAAVFAQGFKEGNISRTTRAESMGTDFETETELMNDEADLMKGLPAYQPTPYSPPPPIMGQSGGRPLGSQNVPVNNRNSGVKLPGQQPTSRVAAEDIELMDDEEVINLMDRIATVRGLQITVESLARNEG